MGFKIGDMANKMQILFLIAVMPLFSFSQTNGFKIDTESTFANLGDYNYSNDHILFAGIDINPTTKSFENASIRIKDMGSGKETVIASDIFFSSPAFGWIDSSHVFYETTETIGEPRIFRPTQSYLIKQNIYTNQRDTIPSSWHSSNNSAENFLASENKLFYTIVYGSEDLKYKYWKVYYLQTNNTHLIKKSDNDYGFTIPTYQYWPEKDEIIYVKGSDHKHEFIRLSVLTGEEKIIKSVNSHNAIESSALTGNNFYYLERVTSNNSEGIPDIKGSNFVIKLMDINTGTIKQIYSFEKGIEVSKMDSYKEGVLLLSVQGDIEENVVNESFTLPKGGNVNIGLNPTSYIWALSIQ